jgi:hypothetical protein
LDTSEGNAATSATRSSRPDKIIQVQQISRRLMRNVLKKSFIRETIFIVFHTAFR